MPLVTALPTPAISSGQPVPAQDDASGAGDAARDGQHAPGRVAAPAPAQKLTPLAPERFILQLTIGGDTQEKLRHAQALLSHRVPSGDLAAVLDLALDALVAKLEKRKFAKTERPRPRRSRSSANPRHVPAHVKRAVWQRDGGRCTFVGDNGHRCNARRFLEYDHIEPVARGGEATAAGVRLRCRMHNQLEAERAFGAGFMSAKRDAARGARVARHSPVARTTAEPDVDCDPRDEVVPTMATVASVSDIATVPSPEIMACLRTLGVRADQARRAIELSAATPASTLEGRVRAALQFLGPKPRRLA